MNATLEAPQRVEDIHDGERYAEFIESDASASAEELRAQMETNSYLFFRGLVPADIVLNVRRQVLELCDADGWLDPAHDVMDAIVSPDKKPTMESQADYTAVYRKVLRIPDFHDFPNDASLQNVARALLGDDVLVHPRRIGRMTFPNYTVATTPPHQDHYYVRGSVDTYSCWIPLGECPISLGGLAVWPKTHGGGFLDHTVHSPGATGGCGIAYDKDQSLWHTTNFGLGDALFFHSYTIHKALPNLSGNKLRVSTDNRYQRPKDSIAPDALLPHLGLE